MLIRSYQVRSFLNLIDPIISTKKIREEHKYKTWMETPQSSKSMKIRHKDLNL